MNRSLWGISLVATAVLTPLVNADTLLHRQAPGRVFGRPSDTLFFDDFGRPNAQLVADTFALSQDASLCRVSAFAFFGGTSVVDPGPPDTETLRIRLFPDAAGLPSEPPLFEANFEDPSRVWTGQFINIGAARKEYLYELPFEQCVPLIAGSPYRIEVAQLGDIDSFFRWESSSFAGGFALQFPLGSPWRLSSATAGQLAYELWTPEPCSGALLALGFALRLCRRAR